MNPTIDTISFANPQHEGLDYDTAEVLMPKGHSRYRLNCRSGSSGGSVGRVQSVAGTTLVSFEFESIETHKTIGYCEDSVSNHIYYFVAGSGSDHLIMRFDATDNTIIVVCRSVHLDFSQNSPIHNPKYVDGVLLWVNGKPQSLIVENAINNHNGVAAGLTSYAAITTQVLDAILYPPAYPPEIEYFDDATRSINNLRGNMWQFAYQYVYVDNGKSCWSPTSKVGKPLYDENVDGRYFEDQAINNCIKVTVETGTNEVKRINIAVRDSNISDWVLIESIDKYDASGAVVVAHNTDHVFSFYNDYRGDALDQMDFDRPFDFVPLESKAMDVIDDEMIVYANNTEGFDNVEMDAELQLVGTQYQPTANPVLLTILVSPADLNTPVANPTNFQLAVYIPPPLPNVTRIYYEIKIYVTEAMLQFTLFGNTPPVYENPLYAGSNTLKFSFGYISDAPHTQLTVMQGINDVLLKYFFNDPARVALMFNFDYTNYVIKFNAADPYPGFGMFEAFGVYKIDIKYTEFSTANKATVFKQGAYHQLGVVYYDSPNRSGFVNMNNIEQSGSVIKRFYVPTARDIWQGNSASYFYRFPILTLNHRPPEWATHYQIAHSGNQSIAKSLMYLIPCAYLRIDTTDNMVKIMVNPQITEVKDELPHINYGTYAFQPGDRVRFINRKPQSIGTMYHYFSTDIDLEILGYDDTSQEIILPNFNPDNYGILPPSAGGSFTNWGFTIEIYTPSKKKEETTIFREIGECYEIGNPGQANRYHKANQQDQDATDPTGTPAVVNLMGCGDSYIISRYGVYNSVEYVYPCETDSYSDYYISDSYDVGRPNKVNKDAKQREYVNYYRHGGRKFPMTNLNFMYKFDYDDFDSVNIDNGEIVGVRQIGYTLKILQEKKVTSQYIGRTELLDNRGQASLQKSDKVFGTKNPSDDDYGCSDPGSILVNDRHLYFFDVHNGCFMRDAANGMHPISKYFMVNFFKQVGADLAGNKGKYDFHTTYNKKHDEVYLTMVPRDSWVQEQDPSQAPAAFTIHFHEDSNRWKSFWSFVPECYGGVNNTMVSFVDGQLHVHETKATHTNFYGVQYKLILDVFSNEHPKQNKLYRSIGVHSNLAFYCPDRGDILIYPNSSYPNGMESRLTKNRFDVQEGIWYAGFMNDMSDPRFATELEALFAGRELRGRVMKVKLTADGHQATELDFVTINSMVSEISI